MLNPITAVTAGNPYSYYAGLTAGRPLFYDERLSMWVASSSEIVESILENPLCRVRPIEEPVPRFLLGTAAGDIFRSLVRMTDGAGHCPLKKAVSETIEGIELVTVNRESRRQAGLLDEELRKADNFSWITDFAFRLPIYVLGRLIGISRTDLAETETAMRSFVRCLAPGSTAGQIERGIIGASKLISIFERSDFNVPANVFLRLISNLEQAGIERAEIAVFNSIGLLFQSYEATAGLLGNALTALAAHPAYLEKIKSNAELLPLFLNEVDRFDPSIQNTRRFTAAEISVDGRKIKARETILLLLAAANRDPAANFEPNTFDLSRENLRSYTFGVGAHACPGRKLSMQVAAAGLDKLLVSELDLKLLMTNITYRESANTRVPLFGG